MNLLVYTPNLSNQSVCTLESLINCLSINLLFSGIIINLETKHGKVDEGVDDPVVPWS